MAKGVEFSVLVSIVIVIVIILSIFYLIDKVLEKNKLVDKFAKSMVWEGENIEGLCGGSSRNLCKEFLDANEDIFVQGELERVCSSWYSNCAKDIEDAPPSPWAKISNSYSDLNLVNYLDIDCKTPEVERLKEKWEENYYFAKKSEEEKYNIIKNACGASLVERIK